MSNMIDFIKTNLESDKKKLESMIEGSIEYWIQQGKISQAELLISLHEKGYIS